MVYTDHFLKKDKQKALQYRKEIGNYFEASLHCLDKFEMDKSRQYFDHAMNLFSELRRMNLEKITSEGATQELSDHALQMRRDWY
ncbi:hypothetical protein [Gracilibacillus dipsosauri]|uniref:Uncharacterized protein n=1 Tax=Gracilibacillus dipsosauri TaxID=178340 RepID=A0A317KYY6_9BACI|nr:hypothetical protein [Gracilibacillus dipsosauri]PWU68294.1 hypothetical protein DLJ74_07515 [Gracilibacillus dipsosauri]